MSRTPWEPASSLFFSSCLGKHLWLVNSSLPSVFQGKKNKLLRTSIVHLRSQSVRNFGFIFFLCSVLDTTIAHLKVVSISFLFYITFSAGGWLCIWRGCDSRLTAPWCGVIVWVREQLLERSALALTRVYCGGNALFFHPPHHAAQNSTTFCSS